MRRILRAPEPADTETLPCDEETLAKLKAAFAQARGNAVRVQELLADEGIDIAYSTLTRWVREAGLRSPPRRAGQYDFLPGREMQHDTSPQRVITGGKTTTAQCAGLVLASSRRLFIQYYPRYSRFEAKAFLLEAMRFMGGSCPLCIIDNTSVIVAHGTGAEAVIAPEMLAFAAPWASASARTGSAIPTAKAGSSGPLPEPAPAQAGVEGNFLAGRSFADYDDLNRQAVTWCRDIANAKPKHALGMSAEAAYQIEKPHLQPLPDALPPVYELLERVVDMHGFVSVDTNRYSVPERFVGQAVAVYKFPAEIHVCKRETTIAVHGRLIGQRDARSTLPGHLPRRGARTAARPAKRSC